LSINSALKSLLTPGKGGRWDKKVLGRYFRNLINPFMSKEKKKELTAGMRNPLGLTGKGERLIRQMMDLNMFIEVDHLSWKAVKDLGEKIIRSKDPVDVKNYAYYPLLAGHTRALPLLRGHTKEEVQELVSNDYAVKLVAESGGIFALRTGPDIVYSYQGKGRIANDCDGSIKSWIQHYLWYAGRDYNVAFGTDTSGFVSNFGPRWGKGACPYAVYRKGGPTGKEQRKLQGAPPYNEKGAPPGWNIYVNRGFVDYGALPSVVHDMKKLGADLTPLMRSAEDFLKMWQSTYRKNRAPVIWP